MLYIDSCNFTKKENSHICEVEIQTMQKYAILATLLKKRELFCTVCISCVKCTTLCTGHVHVHVLAAKFPVWAHSLP